VQNCDDGHELCLLGAMVGFYVGTVRVPERVTRKRHAYREVDCHENFTQGTEILQNIILFTV
jgi:hypothetical protein